jgi:hypothetical protein
MLDQEPEVLNMGWYEDFNWPADDQDPWLETRPEFGYIPLKRGRNRHLPGNRGFYWLWKSQDPKAPTLVQFIGGPGRSVMIKAFGGWNPLAVDLETMTFTKNENPITSKLNLLYIESPVGAGFSVTTIQTSPRTFMEIAENVQEVLEGIFRHESQLKDNSWFFSGEGFCGLSVPSIVFHCRNVLNLDVKGLILENPWLDPLQYKSTKLQREFMGKNDLWENCIHKGTCSGVLCCAEAGIKTGLIKPQTFSDCMLAPWRWFNMNDWKKHPRNDGLHALEYELFFTPHPGNINTEKINVSEKEYLGKPEVYKMLFSEKFMELIRAHENNKKWIPDKKTQPFMEIMTRDKTQKIRQLCSHTIQAGIKITIITGDGDFYTPTAGVEKAIGKWTFEGKGKMLAGEWTEDAEGLMRKTCKNFEWIRNSKMGHMMWETSEEHHGKVL